MLVFRKPFILVFALLVASSEVSKAETGIVHNINIPEMCLIPEDMCLADGSLVAEVTFYNSTPAQTEGDPHKAASGKRTQYGVVACPETLAFGTKVQIGSHVYTCEDRKNKRYRDRDGISGKYYFDVWLQSVAQANHLGVRSTLARVISSPTPPSS